MQRAHYLWRAVLETTTYLCVEVFGDIVNISTLIAITGEGDLFPSLL